MKRNDILSVLIDGTLAALMAIAGVGCLVSAFSLDADLRAVAWTAAIFAGIATLYARLRRGWLLAVLTALLGAVLLHRLDFTSNLYSVLRHILDLYNRGYGWGVPEFLQEYTDRDTTLTMQALAAALAMLAGICLNKKLHSLASLAVLLPVFPCIVITDTVPDAGYLLLGILVLAGLAMTQHARHTDTRQANRLTAMLLIPLVLGGTLLLNRFPQADYTPPDISKGMFSLMERLAEHLPFLNLDPGEGEDTYPVSSNTVHLDKKGPQRAGYSTVLEVIVSRSGALYLRGHSYMGYTGLNWEAWPEDALLAMPDSNYLDATQTIQIQAVQAQTHVYFPYYPDKGITIINGAPEGEVLDIYLCRFKPLHEGWQQRWLMENGPLSIEQSNYAALTQYTQLPDDTYLQALTHLRRAGVQKASGVVQIAQRIADYVKHGAKYDLQTPTMPADQTDFALWFLDSAETGYCVHFATAAAVLLRAAGIPARYVEGYLVDATAGQVTEVRAKNAHAWVEYYVANVGWVILEATPPEGLPIEILPPETTVPGPTTQPTEPTGPTFTQPPETTVPTLPTGPTAPSTPPETTVPTLPSSPTGPTATVPTQPSAPPATDPGDDPIVQRDLRWLKQLLRWLGSALAALLVLLGQWKLRLSIRKRSMAGKDWVHIRRRWRYSCLLARLCRHQPPNALLALLKKAKFSRKGLTDRDVKQFDRYWAACIRGLQRTSLPVRMILRLVFAAW